MIIPSPNIVLYGSGLFGRNVPLNQSQLAQLQASGFTTVILWTLHVYPDGTLFYNDTPIARDGVFLNTFSYLPGLLTELITNSSVQIVLFSIGSGGAGDFGNMRAIFQQADQGKGAALRALEQNFRALSAALPISGFDFDNEDDFDDSTIARLSELLCYDNSMIVTYCPFCDQSLWNAALEKVYAWDQEHQNPPDQSVRWWNLQCYSGGQGNDPVSWAQALPNGAGIKDKAAFIVPGFGTDQSPASIQQQFAQYAGTGIDGGFIWNSGDLFATQYSPTQYAQAILKGLQG